MLDIILMYFFLISFRSPAEYFRNFFFLTRSGKDHQAGRKQNASHNVVSLLSPRLFSLPTLWSMLLPPFFYATSQLATKIFSPQPLSQARSASHFTAEYRLALIHRQALRKSFLFPKCYGNDEELWGCRTQKMSSLKRVVPQLIKTLSDAVTFINVSK